MGACLSRKTSKMKKKTSKTIRVVHLNGLWEDYQGPATVDQVICNFPKHFMCTPVQLLQTGLVPLKLDTPLKPGETYFMLPDSTLRFDASPLDLTSLTRKLANIAKTGRSSHAKSTTTSPSASPSSRNHQAASPSRFPDRRCISGVADNMPSYSCKSPSWKPILASIRERPLNHRSESDLRYN